MKKSLEQMVFRLHKLYQLDSSQNTAQYLHSNPLLQSCLDAAIHKNRQITLLVYRNVESKILSSQNYTYYSTEHSESRWNNIINMVTLFCIRCLFTIQHIYIMVLKIFLRYGVIAEDGHSTETRQILNIQVTREVYFFWLYHPT
jgi:hypothetical protein